MKFKRATLALEMELVHQRLFELLTRFERFCVGMGYGEPVITSLGRSPAFYVVNGLPPKKFSWHYTRPICAADLRKHHLTPQQLEACEAWWEENTKGPQWEFLSESHGTGSHWHVAWRDFVLRKAYQQKTPPPPKETT